ncbi:MAG: succinate dehydrogenase/fumarate reductase iron-sulfur subunit [Candidatus Thorarchaeota archaeon]|nr:MAG: succinate dehydrogenase/fumarate reductase iron-sulfur subunit [Candidatus Thorarchaeota archaeon]
MILRIARSRDGVSVSHFDVFEVETRRGMTVLDALFQIQDNLDPSLAFRYSCRGAVCGSCAMLIDKIPQLACRTQLASVKEQESKLRPFEALTKHPNDWDSKTEILIEPLPNLPLLKDLVVDMTEFYSAIEDMNLWADPAKGESIRIQSPEDRKKIERYVDCILCALCVGSCPINAEKKEYVGPAALTKAYRFNQDSRTPDPERYMADATKKEGAPLCDLIMNCVKVCPKGVAPGGAIRKIKQEHGV